MLAFHIISAYICFPQDTTPHRLKWSSAAGQMYALWWRSLSANISFSRTCYPQSGRHPVAVVLYTFTHKQYTERYKTIHRTTETFGRVRAVPHLCGFYPGICLTTEEKTRKNLSQCSRRVPAGTMKIHKRTIRIHRHNNEEVNFITTAINIKPKSIKPERIPLFVWVRSIPFWFYWLWRSTPNIYRAHFVSLLWKVPVTMTYWQQTVTSLQAKPTQPWMLALLIFKTWQWYYYVAAVFQMWPCIMFIFNYLCLPVCARRL